MKKQPLSQLLLFDKISADQHTTKRASNARRVTQSFTHVLEIFAENYHQTIP